MHDELTQKEKQVSVYISDIMEALGIAKTPDNIETPTRIAKMLSRELFSNEGKSIIELDKHMTAFPNPQKRASVVKIKDIPFHSVCEHHWLPFFGMCDIEYIPNEEILGLSKFPRIVKWFCKKPQVQERLTGQIGEYLVRTLNPLYVKVTLRDTTHTCVKVRGVEAECSTDTVYEFSRK